MTPASAFRSSSTPSPATAAERDLQPGAGAGLDELGHVFLDPVAHAGGYPLPYMAAQLGGAMSAELGDFEPYVEVHGGAKIGVALAPVASVGATAGSTWKFTDHLGAYALLRGDLVVLGFLPTVTANAQVGGLFVF